MSGVMTERPTERLNERPPLVVILAAGKGTRMRSDRPKVLHELAGLSLLGHVLALSEALGCAHPAVVVGPDMAAVEAEALRLLPGASICRQERQAGTADAVRAAERAIMAHDGDVLVLYGDTPLLTAPTCRRMREALGKGAGVVVLGFEPEDPTGYGRLIRDEAGNLLAIREHNDASETERAIGLCNSGVMGFDARTLLSLVAAIGNDNAKGEYYLTDAVAIARERGLVVSTLTCDEAEVLGINDRSELARAEGIWQARARTRAMRAGVSMQAPETVFLSHDTELGRDVTIEPHVVFGPGVTVGDGVRIKAFSHLEGARIAPGATIGPYARLRPGAEIGPDVRIGNFVEVKQATIAAGAKVNHLSYIGDASVGAKANIGAGTITCNYDGFAKHRTEIGAGAFIGSNSALVAPVRIGAGAYVGSGSVISKDVAGDALALTRAPQSERPDWAARFRRRHERAEGATADEADTNGGDEEGERD